MVDMWYTLNIYRRLISISIRGQLQYRVSFVFDILATALREAASDPEIVQYFKDNSLDPYWLDGPEAHAQSKELLERLTVIAADIK